MGKNLIVHNANSLELFPLDKLRPLQGTYKNLSTANLKKMIKSFEEHGFSFPVKIWTDENGLFWIIAGHQRLKTLKTYSSCTVINYLNTVEGLQEISREDFDEVMIPCEQVRAENRKEAIKLLLMEDSRFGTTNNASDFFENEGLSKNDFEDFAIQDLNIEPITTEFDNIDLDEQLEKAISQISDDDQSQETASDTMHEQIAGGDMDKPKKGSMLSDQVKMKYKTEVVNLTFTIPQQYAEKLETKLSEVPLLIAGREREQNLRGRRLLKILLGVEIEPI